MLNNVAHPHFSTYATLAQDRVDNLPTVAIWKDRFRSQLPRGTSADCKR
jgi:hypothetical protein